MAKEKKEFSVEEEMGKLLAKTSKEMNRILPKNQYRYHITEIQEAIDKVIKKLERMIEISSEHIPIDMHDEMEGRGYRKGLKDAKLEVASLKYFFEK